MNKLALFVGDVTLDLTMVASHVPAPDEKVHVSHSAEAVGGVVANAAVACARTGSAVHALFQTGNDSASTRIESGLRERGIEVTVHKVEGRTSRVVLIIEPHGEKRLLLDPGVSMYPDEEAVASLDLANIGWVHTAVYGEAALLLTQRCRRHRVPWSLDLEPASFPAGIETLAPMLDGAAAVFCNDRAAAKIGGDAVAVLLSLGAKAVVRTLGPRGAQYLSPDVSFSVAAPSVCGVTDTTGAGDCLAGWFIGKVLAGASLASALEAAVVAATLSCRRFGAQDSYPDRKEVADVLDARLSQIQSTSEET